MSLRRVEFFDGFESETTPAITAISGTSFLVDNGAPNVADGLDEDKYINLDNGEVFEKVSGSWVSIGTLNLEQVTGDFVVQGNLTVNGTTTTVNSTELETADANITLNKGGTLASAIVDKAGITVEMSDATDAGIFFSNTSASKFRIGTTAANSEIIDTSNFQLVANKEIATPTRLDVKQGVKTSLDIYADTATNGQLVFATDEKKLYQIIDGDLAELNDGGESKLLINQAAHSFTLFEQVSLQDSGTWVKATNTDPDTLPTHTIIEVVDVDNFRVMADTIAQSDAHGFDIGKTYFLKNDGTLTNIKPELAGEYICPAFFPLDANNLQILNTYPQVLITEENGTLNASPYFHGTNTSNAITLTHNVEIAITFPDTETAVGGFTGSANGYLDGYLIPEDGIYTCDFGLLLNSSTAWTEGEYMQMYIRLYDTDNNLKDRRVVDRRFQDSGFAWGSGNGTFSCLKGETIRFSALQVSDVTLTSYTTIDLYVRGVIAKVGQNRTTMLPSLVTTGTMKKQTKILSADVATNTTDITELRFNNLVVGNTYQVIYNFMFSQTGVDGAVSAIIRNGTTIMGQSRINVAIPAGVVDTHEGQFSYVVGPFIATDTDMTVEAVFIQTGDTIRGNGLVTETHATIYEIPMNINEVTEF